MKFWFAFSTQVVCLAAQDAPASLRGVTSPQTAPSDADATVASASEAVPAPPTVDPVMDPLMDPPRRLASLGNGVTENEVGHSKKHIQFVTCPFLGALLNAESGATGAPLLNEDVCRSRDKNGKWDGKCSKPELETITASAGMDPLRVSAHIEGNFANYPELVDINFRGGQLIDIFNMEGAVNEHVTSTGLNDCETVYWNCRTDGSVKVCNSQLIIPGKAGDDTRFYRDIKKCDLHDPKTRDATFDARWKQFLDAQTLPGGKWITHRSLEHAEANDKFPVNDFNGIGGGTISGAFGFLIDACVSCSRSVVRKDPWTKSPYAIEIEALKAWNKDRVFPSGFELLRDGKGNHKGNDNAVRVQWHLGPDIDGRDEDGVSCDDVCASLAFDGQPQVCVDEWSKSGQGSLVGQPKGPIGMAIVGEQAGFKCTGFRAGSRHGPIAVITKKGDATYSPALCLGVHRAYVKGFKGVSCKTRQPKTLVGRKVCPCKPVSATGYGKQKNSAGKRRPQLPTLPGIPGGFPPGFVGIR